MELLQLKYFETVAELEHMTKAAEKLHIAQPALSQSINRLEKDLGVPLFDRTGRQIKLNLYGKHFLQITKAALRLLEDGRKELSDLAGEERGSIHLVASTLDRLTKPLNAFILKYPNINFRITQVTMNEMIELIHDPEVDFCFSAIPLEGHQISAVKIIKEEIYLGVPQNHRLSKQGSIALKQVSDEPFINYRIGNFLREINDSFCREAGFNPHVICEADNSTAIADLVEAGLGVAFVGSCKLDDHLIKLKINSPSCYRTYELAWIKDRYLSVAAQNFKQFLLDYFSRK